MKTLSKKNFIYIFIGLLVFCSTSTTYYRSAHAMEWVGGALAFEEALKWTLAVLGITAAAGMTDAYWDEYGDEFVDYATQNGATQAEVAEWQMKLCEGILDKGSQVWNKFKAWLGTLEFNLPGGGNDSPDLWSGGGSFTVGQVYNYLHTNFGFNQSVNLNLDQNLNSPCVIVYGINGSYFAYIMTSGVNEITGCSSSLGSWGSKYLNFSFNTTSMTKYFTYCNNTTHSSWYSNSNSAGAGLSIDIGSTTPIDVYLYGFNGIGVLTDGSNIGATINYHNLPLDGVSDNVLNKVDDTDLENIDVISSDLPDSENPEVTLPFPGLGSSDNVASSDAYEDIIDAINNGDLPIEKGIEDIQSLLRVIAYNTDTDDVYPTKPDPDNPNENVKKDDVINNNKSNMGFTLAGLENVFPFCIPFDIYAFMTLLVADPVAPEFDFPIKSVNNQTEEIHVDLSPFEPVAIVVRYIFDFLFIIGLGMLTRSLIGGGSSD